MIIGIDLGTTNSLVAVWKEGEAQVVPNAFGKNLTPSAVSLDEDNSILIGQAAKERMSTFPERTAINFKRYMGSDREIKLGKKYFRAEELSSFIIRALKQDAEAFLGEPVTEAIITVPAYFSDAQRKATKVAGELAGLRVERLLNEPTAAAMAYGMHTRDAESKYLVFDLGGGTFDVSILEVFEGMMEVHASSGDNQLGGTDFTRILAEKFLEEKSCELDVKKDSVPEELVQRVSIAAEKAKRELADKGSVVFSVTWNDKVVSMPFSENHFDELVENLLQRLSKPIRGALRDAKILVQEIDEIVLVGGATRMPCVRKLATRLFQRFPATGINPDEVVVQGAAAQAGLKMRDAALDDMVLTDVCPYTLGIEVVAGTGNKLVAGHFQPIIERNNYIPVSRVERFHTVSDDQDKINVNIYQGENPLVKDNIRLGSLAINVPCKPAGEEAVDVRFTYDINGLLEVMVTVLSTKKEFTLVIQENPGVLSPDEIVVRLRELESLKIHPRDQLENVAALNRSERLYRELLGEDRESLGRVIVEFRQILQQQNTREIAEARKRFEEVLDQIEGVYQF